MKSALILVFLLFIPTILMAESLEIAFLPDGGEYLTDRFIVTTRVGVPSLDIDHTLAGKALTGVNSIDNLCALNQVVSVEPFYPAPVRLPGLRALVSRMYVFHVAPGSNVISAVSAFSTCQDVECCDPYIIPVLDYTPNDPSRGSQWHLTKTQAYAAWDIIRGDTTRYSIVGISDTGVYWMHPDLAANMWINVPEDLDGNGTLDSLDINGIDDDGNGYVDDVIGWDFARNDNDPREDAPIHGTHVAGCASEVTDNGLNGAGLGFRARILAAKGGSHDTLTQVYPAMTYAADNGAQIINCSWGSPSFNQSYQNLMNQIWAEGVVIVAAAGNSSSNQFFYPAAYNNVVSVAATTSSDTKASFSNYGTWIDVCAPGQGIYSTFGPSGMQSLDGTSMASPVTCGVLALLRAQNPSWTNLEIVSTLESTCDNIDNLNPSYRNMLGHGRVNAFNAVGSASVPRITIVGQNLIVPGDPDSTLNPGDQFNFSMTLHNAWANADSVWVTLHSNDLTFTDSSVFFGTIGHGLDQNNDSNPFQGSANIDIIPGLKPVYVHITASGGYVINDTLQINVSMSLPGFPKYLVGEVESSPLIYDLDGDGINEVIVGASDNKVYVFRADGSNQPGWPKDVSSVVISAPAVGDIDHDGVNEVVAVSKDGHIYAWHANGTLLSGFPVNKGGTFWAGPTIQDIDGDNHMEIIVGSFTDNMVYAINYDGTDHQGWPQGPFNKWYYGSPSVGDLDGDGLQEVIYAGWDSLVHAWNGDGSSVSGFPVRLNGPVFTSVAVGDVDHDGQIDIVAVTNPGYVYVIRHDGSIAPGFPVNVGAFTRSGPALADLNGDGTLEIIFGTNSTGLFALSSSNGEPLPGFPKTVTGAIYGTPVVGDISGDGLPDIVFGTNGGYIYALDHSANNLRNFPIPGDANHQITASAAIGDLDGNGTMEIAVPVKTTSDANLLVLSYREQALVGNLQWPCYGRDHQRSNNFALNPNSINDPSNLPAMFSLAQNYPNPFNPTTAIEFSLKKASNVTLSIFDILGREVKMLYSGPLTAGTHSLIWNSTDQSGNLVTSGIYFYRLESSEGSLTKRMVLLK
jgi:serine protease